MVPQAFHTRVAILFLLVIGLAATSPLTFAQQSENRLPTAAGGASGPGIYLVFPFENSESSPRLDWLGEGLEELTIQRLSLARQQVYSHDGRTNELDRYGLPPAAKLSHASMLRVAEDLDADYVVFGSYSSDGKSLSVTARLLRVSPTGLLPTQKESGTLDSLMDLQTRLIWKLLHANDSKFRMNLGEFAKLQTPLRLDAFEHYVRGRLASEDETRIRELKEAARLEPQWADPDFALGENYFSRRDCDSAIPWFAHVPKTHEKYVEALFATGVCRLQTGQPEKAEEIFMTLQEKLRHGSSAGNGPGVVSGADLPEILNDLAIALARQGKTPEAQTDLRRASEIDPDEDDYLFNLGLLALRGGDFGAAAGYFHKAAEEEPENAEDRALSIYSLEKAGRKAEADQERESAAEEFGPNGLPNLKIDAKGEALARLDRIKSELDITALRLDIQSGETPASSAGAATSEDTPTGHVRRGRQEFSAGHLDAAEKEFRAVLATDSGNATAHRGLGEIARRREKLDEAVKELQASLAARDSAVVRMILARIYLEQKKPELARGEAEKALKLAPNYVEAKTLLERLNGAKPAGGTR